MLPRTLHKLSQLDRIIPRLSGAREKTSFSPAQNGLNPLPVKDCPSKLGVCSLTLQPITTSAPLCLSLLAPKASPRARSPYGDGAKLASIIHLTFYFSIFGAKNGTIRPSLCCSINPSPNGNSSRLMTIELGSKSLNK